MIVHSLKCKNDHTFESWFQTIAAYETQKTKKMIECPFCNSTEIETVFTPLPVHGIAKQKNQHASKLPVNPLKELETFVKSNCDYVGKNFAEIARQIHYGECKSKRGIYGETTKDEAKTLKEEGIEFISMPSKKLDS